MVEDEALQAPRHFAGLALDHLRARPRVFEQLVELRGVWHGPHNSRATLRGASSSRKPDSTSARSRRAPLALASCAFRGCQGHGATQRP